MFVATLSYQPLLRRVSQAPPGHEGTVLVMMLLIRTSAAVVWSGNLNPWANPALHVLDSHADLAARVLK